MSQLLRPSPRVSILIATVLGTGYLTALIMLSRRGGWSGYAAGLGDHNVLMPQGISWATPSAFKNDWFLGAAPQPHWFFDLLIAAGVKTNLLDYILFSYWVLGLAVFTLATILFAKLVAVSPWVPSFLVLTLAGLAPWGLFGTGTGTIGMALPTVLAGNLIYLVIVLLLRGALRTAAVVGAIVAIIHVQQGSIIAIIFAVTIVALLVAKKRLAWPLIFGFIANATFVMIGLRLRPVAANPGDFVEVCNTVIPYHCSVWQWPWVVQVAAIGGVLAAALTVLAMKRSQLLMWASTIGLVLLGYTLGFLADALRIPLLGELAQSVNANRLGSIIVPFMLWGLLLPLLRLRAFPEFRKRPGSWLVLFGVWAVVTGMALIDPSWNVIYLILDHRWLTLTFGAVTVLLLLLARWLRPELIRWIPPTAMVAFCLTSAIVAGVIGSTFAANWYMRGEPTAIQEWSREVGELVPAGEIVTAPGTSDTMRLYSQRATIVDCKNVPYGGTAWEEWKQRTRALGIDCKNHFTYGPEMTVAGLAEIAQTYSSGYVIVDATFENANSQEILRAGWRPLLGPSDIVGWWLFQLPEKG